MIHPVVNTAADGAPHAVTGAALVVAHAAHELRLHAWLKRVRPSVHILTTGSRSGADLARIRASEALVRERGARRGAMFGALLDRDLYAAVMAGDARPFERLTKQIAQDLVAQDARLVVVDGWQYYNAAHDIAHVMGRVAAAQAASQLGRAIEVLDYPVVSPQLAPHQPAERPRQVLALAADEAADKARAAAAYPDIELELAELAGHEGERAFAVEIFDSPPPLDSLLAAPAHKPEYERYGEERVKAGLYREVLRWAHVERIVAQLAALRPAARTR